MQEANKLMKDLATEVVHGGEMIDDIIVEVEKVPDHIGKAQVQLVKKKKRMDKKTKRYMWCTIWLIIILATILFFVIVGN